MKIIVDKANCTGHGCCAMVTPEIYESDSNGYIAFAERSLPEEMRQRASRGARACPERVIQVEPPPTE